MCNWVLLYRFIELLKIKWFCSVKPNAGIESEVGPEVEPTAEVRFIEHQVSQWLFSKPDSRPHGFFALGCMSHLVDKWYNQ